MAAAPRREQVERRPSARPTTRRSFSSALRAQLPPQESRSTTREDAVPDSSDVPAPRGSTEKQVAAPAASSAAPSALSSKRSVEEPTWSESSVEEIQQEPKRSRV